MNRHYVSTILLFASFAHFVFFAPVATAKMPSELRLRKIIAKEVQGSVMCWQPWASGWEKVEAGMELWENTLVQVGANANLTFVLDAKHGFTGLQADRTEVTLNKPTVIRLDREILRKVTFNTFFIPQLPDVTESEKKEELYHNITEAWDRFSALVIPSAVKASWLKLADQEKSQKEQDSTMAMHSQRIKMFNPQNNSMALTDKLPVELTVLWRPIADPNAVYEVMIWRIDEPRRPPVTTTRFDFYYAKLYSEGNYYVQVATTDGRYQSNVAQVNVMLPMPKAAQRALASSPTGENLPIPLVLPPDQFTFLTRSFPAAVTFQWDRASFRNGGFNFVLADAGGKELTRKSTTDRIMRIKINRPGEYRWYIEAATLQKRKAAERKTFSEVRTFTIAQPPAQNASAFDSINDMILAKGKGVLYLDEGMAW